MSHARDFIGIEPGDVGHTTGVGIPGWIIRTGTESYEGHSFIFHAPLGKAPSGLRTAKKGYLSVQEAVAAFNDALPTAKGSLVDTWVTAEAWGDGVKFRVRTLTDDFVGAQRPADNLEQAAKILAHSTSIVEAGTKYGWGEIARIALHKLHINTSWGAPDRNSGRKICSHAAAESVQAGCPALIPLFNFPAVQVWPGELMHTLQAADWQRDRINDQLAG